MSKDINSYKAFCEQYKNDKKMLSFQEEKIKYPKKKNKKKVVRSNHKHEYVPAIIHYYEGQYLETTCGTVCKTCGRVQDFYFKWTYSSGSESVEEWIERYKLEHPDCIEVWLPQGWDFWKDKFVPLG